MKTEELIALGLTQEQADTIFAMNGKDINEYKLKAETADATNKELQGQLDTRNADILELQKVDGKLLQTKLTELQGKYDTETSELSQKLQQQTLNNKLELGLLTAKAKNITAAKALLNLDAIKLDGDNLLGFNDQLQKITKENPYLFGEEQTNPVPGAGGAAIVTKDAFAKMGYKDRLQLSNENQQLYNTLKGD